MRLLQRKIMLGTQVLGELGYLGYTTEGGMIVRFLLEGVSVAHGPIADVIGSGKLLEVEIELHQQDVSFQKTYILKMKMDVTGVFAPELFLASIVRKINRRIKRAVKDLEDPPF